MEQSSGFAMRFARPVLRQLPVLAALVIGAATRPLDAQPPVVEWLRAQAIPIRTVQPGGDLSDLEALRTIVGGARLVLLGEATHGGREFFQLKHRLLEFLVREMGFTVLAIETMFGRTLVANDYITGRTSDRDAALAALGGWVRSTEEHQALLDWMRDFNRTAPPDRGLRLYGVDMQDGRGSLDALLAYLFAVDSDYAALTARRLAPLTRLESYEDYRGYSRWPADSLAPIRDGIAGTAARLRANREPYLAASSAEEWAVAAFHARVLAQAEETWRDPHWPATGALRDRFMAENLLAIQELTGSGARVVVSAHNGHVTRGQWGNVTRLGGYLVRAGSQLVVFGFAFDRGSFQARHHETNEVGEHTVGAAPPGSISATLAAVGLPLFLIDLRRAPREGPVAKWLTEPHPERSVGAVFNPNWEPIWIAPAEHYDVVLFVAATTRARPVVPAPRRP